MTDDRARAEMRQVLDEVFRDHDLVTRRELYSCASEHVLLPADLLAQLAALPDGPFGRQELTQAIDRLVTREGDR